MPAHKRDVVPRVVQKLIVPAAGLQDREGGGVVGPGEEQRAHRQAGGARVLEPEQDEAVVNVALRTMGEDLDASLAQLQWVTNGYFLSLASLILLGGSLGDRLGRRRVFVIGTVWFALASLLCGLAPTAEVLVVARVLQGVGGALLTPGSLAMIQGSFRPRDRAKAIGAWSGLGGIAGAIGPLVGGVMLDKRISEELLLVLSTLGEAAGRRALEKTTAAMRCSTVLRRLVASVSSLTGSYSMT